MKPPSEPSSTKPDLAQQPENAAATPAPVRQSIVPLFKEIGWAFMGIGKSRNAAEKAGKITPLRMIAVALVAFLLFVLALVAVVHMVAPR